MLRLSPDPWGPAGSADAPPVCWPPPSLLPPCVGLSCAPLPESVYPQGLHPDDLGSQQKSTWLDPHPEFCSLGPSTGTPIAGQQRPALACSQTPPVAYLSVQSGQERVELDVQCAAAHAHGCLQDLAETLQGEADRQDLLALSPIPPGWGRLSAGHHPGAGVRRQRCQEGGLALQLYPRPSLRPTARQGLTH